MWHSKVLSTAPLNAKLKAAGYPVIEANWKFLPAADSSFIHSSAPFVQATYGKIAL